FFFSSRRRHTRSKRDWSSDVCSSDLHKIEDTDEVLQAKLKEIRQYAVVPEQYSNKLVLQAKFGVAVEKWMEVNEIDAVAIQCWRSEERRVGREWWGRDVRWVWREREL